MAAPTSKPASAPAPAAGAPAPYVRAKRPRVDWKAVWPIPLALTAAGALVGGLFLAVARAPKDDPGIPLAEARSAYQSDKFLDVIEIINADLVPYINAGKLSEEQEKEFFQLRARSLFYGQERMGVTQAENFKAIADAYEQGRRRGMGYEPADIGNLAESYLHTGEVAKAIDLARSLEGRDDARRLRLYERIVESQLRAGSTQYPVVLGLLNEMLQMPALTVEQRAWVVSRQAQLRLEAGFAQEAITRLLREMPKFESLDGPVRAQLLFLLGKAYAEGVDEQQAVVYLEQAMRTLLAHKNEKGEIDENAPLVIDNFDPRIGEALVIQGRIYARNGQIEEARERFQTVREGFKDTAVYTQAVLGEADAAAALGDYESALKFYAEAADRVAAGGPAPPVAGVTPVTLDLIGAKLMDQYERRVLQNDPVEALKFVRKAQEVYKRRGKGTIPSDVYLAMARASRLNAEIMLREAGGTPHGEPAPRPDEVSPVTAATAKGHLLDAGQNFRDYAGIVTGTDFNARMQGLLAAGDCFDQAGAAAEAIEAYSLYISDASPQYIDKPRAIFRLAQVYQSVGDFRTAAKWYKQLVDGDEGPAGQWADRSLVPLARCYVSDPTIFASTAKPADGGGRAEGAAGATQAERNAEKPNEEAAITLLNRAISGRAGIGPDAVQMREAQVELGELYYRRGEFRRAIETFNRLIDTYHDQTPRLPTVLFKRADAHRQLAMAIVAAFDQSRLAERQELEEAKRNHLRDARAGYQEALLAIAKRGQRATKVEKLFQRNAAFYTADCAYLLKEYEQAVQEYARAGEQYSNDPASLVAKVQTVSCFIRLGRWDDAQVAAERAKSFLSSFPDDVWTNPDTLLPMERRHWEAWLAARIELDGGSKKSAAVNTPSP